jgi:uncharacterized protein (UPF0335 family)
MEEIIKVIVYSICGIITAAAGLVIAYLKRKTDRLESEKNKVQKEKETLRTEIRTLHNGFREYVYKELVNINKKFKELGPVVEKQICKNCNKEKR